MIVLLLCLDSLLGIQVTKPEAPETESMVSYWLKNFQQEEENGALGQL